MFSFDSSSHNKKELSSLFSFGAVLYKVKELSVEIFKVSEVDCLELFIFEIVSKKEEISSLKEFFTFGSSLSYDCLCRFERRIEGDE